MVLLLSADESTSLSYFERILLTCLTASCKKLKMRIYNHSRLCFVACGGSVEKFPVLLWVRIRLYKNRASRSTLQINGILA